MPRTKIEKMDLGKKPGIIPALDISVGEAGELIQKLGEVEDYIAAYKISSLHAFEFGLKGTVAELRKFTEKPIIYDHQKAATDIPSIVEKQAKAAAEYGVNAFIGVPLGAGSKTLEAFVGACKESGLLPIILLEMTQEGATDYLKDATPRLVFDKANELGVTHFVCPGNKYDKIAEYKGWIGEGSIMSPGIKAQGGKCEEAVKAGTDYPIVGRGVYQAEDPVAAVKELYEQAKRGFESR